MNFYVMGCITFFKSKSEHIRANAALFVGFLLGNLKKEDRHTVSTDHCCGGWSNVLLFVFLSFNRICIVKSEMKFSLGVARDLPSFVLLGLFLCSLCMLMCICNILYYNVFERVSKPYVIMS